MKDYILNLEEALADKSQVGTFRLYKIDVGGEVYIGFTSQEPERRMEQHVEAAKTGSQLLVHKKLREFGFYYDFVVLETYSNEVEALLNEIISIKKFNASLNLTEGGEGKKYHVIREQNEHGELVFKAKNLQKEKEVLELEARKANQRNGAVLESFLIELQGLLDEFEKKRMRDLLEMEPWRDKSEKRSIHDRVEWTNLIDECQRPFHFELAEIFKECREKFDINLAEIRKEHTFYLQHPKPGVLAGEDFGLDEQLFKTALDWCLAEVKQPSKNIKNRAVVKEMLIEMGVRRPCTEKQIRSFETWLGRPLFTGEAFLESNRMNSYDLKTLGHTYEIERVNIAELRKNREITDRNSYFFEVCTKNENPLTNHWRLEETLDFDEDKIRTHFSSQATIRMRQLQKIINLIDEPIKYLICWGEFEVKEKGFFRSSSSKLVLNKVMTLR